MTGAFRPPAGFTDLDADCDRLGEQAVTVGKLTLWTLPVTTRDVGALSRCLRAETAATDRDAALRDFLSEHMDPDSFESLLHALLEPLTDTMLIGQVMKAVCLRDTARPWRAFASLVASVGREWRVIRGRLVACGVTAPLDLPSIHVLLDYVEWIVTENMDDEARADYNNKVYLPEVGTVPEGFTAAETMASFDALFDAMGDMR